MDYLSFRERICRICLEDNVSINWNDEIIENCGVSYKDCYLKYTELKDTGSDYYPRNFCDKCAYQVRNSHNLFEKALESFNVLQNYFKNKEFKSENSYAKLIENSWQITQNNSLDENSLIESLKDEKSYIDEEEVVSFPLSPDDIIDKTENSTINCEDIPTNEVIASPESVDDTNDEIPKNEVITIKSFKSTFDNPLQEQPIDVNDIKLLKLSIDKQPRNRNKRKKLLNPTHKKSTNVTKQSKAKKFLQKSKVTGSVKHIPTKDVNEDSNQNTNLDDVTTISLTPCSIERYISEESQIMPELTQNEVSEEIHEVIKKKSRRSKPKPYLCQYCPYKARDARRITAHEATHIEKRERNIVCSKCNVKFYTKLALKGHMETHNENRIRKHQCEFCEKAFFNKGALNVHRRIHLGLMYKCPICENEYYRQLDLDRHLVKHSVTPARDIEKKQYVVECEYCNKPVLTNKLKEHIAVHLNKPQAKCKICEKDFFTKARVTSHLHRFHKVDSSDYSKYTHCYVNTNSRASFLKLRQERQVKLLTK